jgi:hypothetical protein
MSGREGEEELRIEEHPGNEGIRPAEGNRRDNEVPESERVRFHYDREARLKKLRTQGARTPTKKWGRLFAGKKSGRLIILLANMALIYLIAFTFVRPSNVYVRQNLGEYNIELNVTALRGKKTLIGFTVRNGNIEDLVFRDPVPVSLNIRGRSGAPVTSRKYIEADTVLAPGESTSVIFLFEEAELPRTADLEIFFDDYREPLFKRNVRF